MTLEIQCAGCGRVLRVPTEHAGKQARCPACGEISKIAPSLAINGQGTSGEAAATPPSWSMRTPEGQVYGPIARGELDRWFAEGRITSECELCAGAALPWVGAEQIYPQLRPVAWTPPSPYLAPTPVAAALAGPPLYQMPHRGGMILILGILGFVMSCPIFSLMAWVMGSADLRAMRAGRMDSSGQGMTQAGFILGAILSLLWIGICVLLAIVFIIAAAAGG